MNLNQHRWRLISRKMAGEASPKELQQLQLLTQHDRQLRTLLAILAELWRSTEPRDEMMLEQAWQRHAIRLENAIRNNP